MLWQKHRWDIEPTATHRLTDLWLCQREFELLLSSVFISSHIAMPVLLYTRPGNKMYIQYKHENHTIKVHSLTFCSFEPGYTRLHTARNGTDQMAVTLVLIDKILGPIYRTLSSFEIGGVGVQGSNPWEGVNFFWCGSLQGSNPWKYYCVSSLLTNTLRKRWEYDTVM